MLTHYVIHDGGAQSIVGVPVDESGELKAATSATYAIYNLRHYEDATDRTVVAAGTAGTVDAASELTDASAGRGTADPRKISVADSSVFTEGSEYLIQHSDGRSEGFKVDHIDSTNDNLFADHELAHLYPTSSTVKGVEVTATFPSAEAADDAEFDQDVQYAIDWVFVGVVPTRRRDLVKVRRTAERVYASVDDIKTLDAKLAPYSGDRFDLSRCLIQAHRDFRRRLRERGIDPDEYNGGETARDAVTYRAAQIARQQMDGERDQVVGADYGEQFNAIMSSLGGVGEVLTDRQDDTETGDLAERLHPFGLT